MNRDVYIKAMKNCRLEKGRLYLTTFYSLENLVTIWNHLTSDILGAKIPNYRPIAFCNNNKGNWCRNFPTLWVPHYDATFSKMQDNLNYLCLGDKRYLPVNSWGYCTPEQVKETYEFPSRDLHFGEYAGQEILYHAAWPLPDRLGCGGTAALYQDKGGRKHEMGILNDSRDKFELVWTPVSDDTLDDDDPFNIHWTLQSKDFRLPKEGLDTKDVMKSFNQTPHDWLLPDRVVAEQNWSREWKYSGTNLPTRYLVLLYKGTGFNTEKDNARLILSGITRFTFEFVKTDFGLSKIFSAKYPKSGGVNYLDLVYIEEGISESVLKKILEDYGRSLD